MASSAPDRGDATVLLAGLGGKSNLASVQVAASRLIIELRDAAAVDDGQLQAAGYRGAMRVADNVWHVIAGPATPAAAAKLRKQ